MSVGSKSGMVAIERGESPREGKAPWKRKGSMKERVSSENSDELSSVGEGSVESGTA